MAGYPGWIETQRLHPVTRRGGGHVRHL